MHVTLTLDGSDPPIRRSLIVDRDLPLADLHRVAIAVLGGPDCSRHVFRETAYRGGWSPRRRSWGDRWTMIDFRDPTVVDEETARVGEVLSGVVSLVVSHSCSASWVVEIEGGPDEFVGSAQSRVLVSDGSRAAPLACSRGTYEHDVMCAILADPTDPDHDDLAASLAHTRGPWAHRFDPDRFDILEAQRAVDVALAARPPQRGRRSRHHDLAIAALISALPAAAQAPTDSYLATIPTDLPPVITHEETDAAVRIFRWVVEQAASGALVLTDGAVESNAIATGTGELGCDSELLARTISASRALRLVYSRNGRLQPKKAVLDAAGAGAGPLWTTLVNAVAEAHRTGSAAARRLLLLAIVDGSLSDPAIGTRRIAHAYSLVLAKEGTRSTWSYYADDRIEACAQSCDCAPRDAMTWHDVVARAIRGARRVAVRDGGQMVWTGGVVDDEFPSEWHEDEHRWLGAPLGTIDRHVAPGSEAQAAVLMTEVRLLIDLLMPIGLDHDRAADTWVMSPAVREFARCVLRQMNRRRSVHPF